MGAGLRGRGSSSPSRAHCGLVHLKGGEGGEGAAGGGAHKAPVLVVHDGSGAGQRRAAHPLRHALCAAIVDDAHMSVGTVADLVEGAEAPLVWPSRLRGREQGGERVVRSVVWCGPNGPDSGQPLSGAVVVADGLTPAAGRQLAAELAGFQAAALVDAAGLLTMTAPGLPVLWPVRPGTAAEVAAAVMRLVLERAVAAADLADRLRGTTEAAARRAGRLAETGDSTEALLRWTTEALRAVDGDQSLHVDIVEPSDPRYGRWQPHAGTGETTVGDQHVLVWSIDGEGRDRPGLLVARRTGVWAPEGVTVLTQIAGGIAVARRAAEAELVARRARDAAMPVRISALQLLMTGQWTAARRTVTPLTPGLLDQGAGQVAIVERGVGETRDDVLAETDHVLAEDAALVIACPQDYDQVVVVGAGRIPLEQHLRDVAERVPQRAVGVSALAPLETTGRMYGQAVAALEVSRGRPGCLAVHDGRRPLPELLGARARAWARALLAHVLTLPDQGAALLADVTRTLADGAPAASALLGVDPKTLRERVDQVCRLVELDRDTPGHLETLDLAVQLVALEQPPPGTVPVSSAATALDVPGAREWAHQRVERLSDDVIGTLVAWLDTGRSAAAAAAKLGVHRNTVGRHLAGAAAQLGLPLTKDRPGAAHEIAWAFHIAGVRPLDTVTVHQDRLQPQGETMTTPGYDYLATDRTEPATAAIYNYLAGGEIHTEVDRQAAARVLEVYPTAAGTARENRMWLERGVTYAARQGVRQYADIGCGILPLHSRPEGPATAHYLADRELGTGVSRVLYTDYDVEVVRWGQQVMRSGTEILPLDVADTEAGLAHLGRVLDLTAPVCLIMGALLHFVPDDETAYQTVATYVEALAPGSYLVLSHATESDETRAARQHYTQQVGFRTTEQIARFFNGLELVDPGLVRGHRWRPELLPGHAEAVPAGDTLVGGLVAVGRKV